MKTREWSLEVEPESSGSKSFVFRVGLWNAAVKQTLNVTPSCKSLEELQQEISRIKAELDDLQEQASEKLQTMLNGESAGGCDPKEAWRKMESCASDEEMFAYFNAFSVPDRQKIAEYILSSVSMFKGRGPVFSENYDASSHILG